jgi:hypothetical protein
MKKASRTKPVDGLRPEYDFSRMKGGFEGSMLSAFAPAPGTSAKGDKRT